ncbi:MAG: sigma-70 family RNA polymerase sigma factor [Bacteroidota bacterium]|nr:sigma-70 family RNA polymerase sigma factor [Bacteroidota bacterium]
MKNEILEELVSKHTEEMFNWAYHKTSSVAVAEDLVQDSFLAATEKIDSFKGNSSAKTWLFSILNHKIIDFYRKKVNQTVGIESGVLSTYFDDDQSWQENRKLKDWQADETHLLDDDDFRIIMEKCLEALPEQWNMCVKLKYLSEKKGEEICQELGIAPTNFWQIVHRAKLKLRDCIEDNWFLN